MRKGDFLPEDDDGNDVNDDDNDNVNDDGKGNKDKDNEEDHNKRTMKKLPRQR